MNLLLLKLNLQLFATDESHGGASNNQDNNSNENKDQTQTSDETKNTDNMIPYSRFKEVNDNYKTVKSQLDELLQKQQTDELEAKKKAGQFEELYNNLQVEHAPLKEQATKYQELFKTMLDTKMEQVPENYKELIPNGLDDVSKLAWIDNAISKGLFGNNSQVKSFGNKGNNPSSSTSITKDDFAKMTYKERVKLANDDPELYRRLSR